MKLASAKRTKSPGVGRDEEPDHRHPKTNGPSRPTSSVPFVPIAVSALPWSCLAAIPRPCNGIWTRSHPRWHQVPTPFSCLIRPDGTLPTNWWCRKTSPSSHCRPNRRNSTQWKTSGSSSARIGYRNEYSLPTTRSSLCAAKLGTS